MSEQPKDRRSPVEPDGAAMIAAERQRQIAEEGWTAEHDDKHVRGELIQAAVSYLLDHPEAYASECGDEPPDHWPWDASWWKPSDDPIRNLVKAGALIAAEIDRLEAADLRRFVGEWSA